MQEVLYVPSDVAHGAFIKSLIEKGYFIDAIDGKMVIAHKLDIPLQLSQYQLENGKFIKALINLAVSAKTDEGIQMCAKIRDLHEEHLGKFFKYPDYNGSK